MREINAQLITDKVAELCIDANCSLPCDIRKRIEDARANEPWATAQGILDKIIENYNIADENRAPICQDTGVACVFLKDRAGCPYQRRPYGGRQRGCSPRLSRRISA